MRTSSPPGELALALVNSENRSLGSDALVDAANARTFLAAHPLTAGATPTPLSPTELTLLVRVRPRVREVFIAARDEHHAHAVVTLNQLLALHAARPHLVGQPPRLSVVTSTASYTTTWVSAALVGLAQAVELHGLDRLGTCAALGCQQCFVDTSPRGDRRFCTRQCANRTHTAALRHRTTSAQE